jgi:hypothetical protein
MDVLRQYISFEKKERKQGATSVYFKLSTTGQQASEGESLTKGQHLRLMAVLSDDGVVLVHMGDGTIPSAPVVSFNNQGKVFVYNPNPVLTTMAQVLANEVANIASNNAQKIAKISQFQGMEESTRESVVNALVPFLFLCNAKLTTAKALALNFEASRDASFLHTLRPMQERIDDSWASRTQATKFASYLLKKLDPQRKGLKTLLNSLFDE